MKKIIFTLASVLFLIGTEAKTQFIEDALRLNEPNGMITPRSSTFGSAFVAIADDYSALYYNPAGLTLMPSNEISLGLGLQFNKINANFLGNANTFNSNDSYISNFGVVSKIPDKLKTTFAIGYFLENNYNRTTEYAGFNHSSSYIGWSANNTNPNFYEDNMMYHLWLADSLLYTPIQSAVQQNVFIMESGGLHNITGGMGFELGKNMSLGFSLTAKFGSYKYHREYTETDRDNNYTEHPYNFTDFYMEEFFEQDITGITGSVGLIIKLDENGRIGLSIKVPTYYSIDEMYGTYAEASFDDGFVPNPYDPRNNNTSYNIRTPFVYTIAGSYHIAGLTLAAGVEYSDAKQITFSSGIREIEQINRDIIRDLTGQLNWSLGAEYDIPSIPLIISGGFSYISSPYATNPINNDKIIFGGGLGFLVAENILLNVAARYTDYSERYVHYSNFNYDFNMQPFNLNFGLTYRFK